MHIYSWSSSLIVVGLFLITGASLSLASLTPKHDDTYFSEIIKRGDSSDSKTTITDPKRVQRSRSASPAPVSSIARGRFEAINTPTPTRSLSREERRKEINREAARRTRANLQERLQAEDPEAIQRQENKRKNDRNWRWRDRVKKKGVKRSPYKERQAAPRKLSPKKESQSKRGKKQDKLTPEPSAKQHSGMLVTSEVSRDNNRQETFTTTPHVASGTPFIPQPWQAGLMLPMPSTRTLPIASMMPTMPTTSMTQHAPLTQHVDSHSHQVWNSQMMPTTSNSPSRSNNRRTSSDSLWSTVRKVADGEIEVASPATDMNARQRGSPESPLRHNFDDDRSAAGMPQTFGPHNVWPQVALPDPNQHINRIPPMPLPDQQISQPPVSDAAKMVQIFHDFQRDL